MNATIETKFEFVRRKFNAARYVEFRYRTQSDADFTKYISLQTDYETIQDLHEDLLKFVETTIKAFSTNEETATIHIVSENVKKYQLTLEIQNPKSSIAKSIEFNIDYTLMLLNKIVEAFYEEMRKTENDE